MRKYLLAAAATATAATAANAATLVEYRFSGSGSGVQGNVNLGTQIPVLTFMQGTVTFDTARIVMGPNSSFFFMALPWGGDFEARASTDAMNFFQGNYPYAPTQTFGITFAEETTGNEFPTSNVAYEDGGMGSYFYAGYEYGYYTASVQAFSVRLYEGEEPFAPFSLGVQIFGVPEPQTWAMMIGGFSLVGGAMRRSSGRARALV